MLTLLRIQDAVTEITLVLPLCMLMQKLQMADSKIFLTLAYMSFVLPFVIWILHSYFENIFFTPSYHAKTVTVAISESAPRHMIGYGLMMPVAC